MRKILLPMMLWCISTIMYAQSFDQERIALAKFIERMYNDLGFVSAKRI